MRIRKLMKSRLKNKSFYYTRLKIVPSCIQVHCEMNHIPDAVIDGWFKLLKNISYRGLL